VAFIMLPATLAATCPFDTLSSFLLANKGGHMVYQAEPTEVRFFFLLTQSLYLLKHCFECIRCIYIATQVVRVNDF
jgi:hypothetical protein